MSRTLCRRDGALILALAAMAGLAGCGKTGAMERPAPLFGAARHAPVDQTVQTQDPNRPLTTIDERDRDLAPVPPRNDPIQGTAPDPFAAPPQQGALPDARATPDR